jgi:hypothetical protein
MSYPIQDRGPSLHGDALEDCKHGIDDVVERGDAVVRTLPLLQTDGNLRIAAETSRRSHRRLVGVARHLRRTLQTVSTPFSRAAERRQDSNPRYQDR